MLKLVFTHAEVRDSGFGLEVNGKSLEDIISEALGTKAEGLRYDDPRLKTFSSNSCDITVMICPHDKETLIETDDEVFHSLKDMEEDRRERFTEEIGEAEEKAEGTLVYKKVAARKLGISVAEYNRRMKRREKNLKEITGGNENGKG